MGMDFIIEHIRDGHGLDYEISEKRGYKWVSEGMEDEVKQWFPEPVQINDSMLTRYLRYDARRKFPGFVSPTPVPLPPSPPVLIQAPTGSGKNFFVINVLGNAARSRGKRILVLTNRKALCKQQLMEADKMNGLPLFGDKVYEDYDNSKYITILTYQEVIPFLERTNQAALQTIESVIFDEAHFFSSDSTFNANTSKILRSLLVRFFSCKRIYMSATPEDVKPLLALEELRVYAAATCNYNIDNDITSGADEISRIKVFRELPKIKEFVFPATFGHVILHFFYDWNSIVSEIKLQTEKENSSDTREIPEKWLIFRQTKEEGRALKKELGADADFVCAEDKKDNNKRLQRIVEKKRFDKKVLISTTVLYNGISIEDIAMKHIVVDTLNHTEVIQMLGRKRICEADDVVNLYIRIPEESEIESRIDHLYLFFCIYASL